MKRRELLLGGSLVAALIVGFVLTRGSGVGDEGGLPVTFDLSSVDGSFEVEDLTVEVTAGPRPLRVFERLRFALRFSRDGRAVSVTAPRLDFNMVMDMGPHAYQLVNDETGAWVADEVILPQCGSGSRLWFADLGFEADGASHEARLRLVLEPPRAD